MARSPYHSNAGSIDASGVAGLGDAAMATFNDILGQGRYDREMSMQMRAQAAEQANARARMAIEQQIAQQQAAEADKRRKAEEQGRILELAQVVDSGDTFLKLAPILAPELSAAELQGYATFADETSRMRKEAEKAKKAEEQQALNRGVLLQGGGLQGIAALPGMGEAVPRIAQQTGIDPVVLGDVTSGLRAREEQKRAEAEAKWQREEAGRNARAAMRTVGSDENVIDTSDPSISRSLRLGVPKPILEGYLKGKPGFYEDPIVPEVKRAGHSENRDRTQNRAASLRQIRELRVLAEMVGKAGVGGVGAQTIAEMARRVGERDPRMAAAITTAGSALSNRTYSITGAASSDQERAHIREGFSKPSEWKWDAKTGKLHPSTAATFDALERAIMNEYISGAPGETQKALRRRVDRHLSAEERGFRRYWKAQFGGGESDTKDIDAELEGLLE